MIIIDNTDEIIDNAETWQIV